MSSPPLRILLAHNYYRSSAPSGEDAVFENERRLLEENGFTVIPFIRRNDDLDDSTLGRRLAIARDTGWSRDTYGELSALLRLERPHLAHFHNTFPQISPSAYRACQDAGVPVVQTLHNFRLICAGALLQREGRPCEDCVGTSPVLGLWPGLRHRCYRGSLAATGALTLMLARNRLNGSYRTGVDRYIALTRFAAGRLTAGGLPADRFTVKPNFLPNPPPPGDGSGGYAVYVGRLSAEKGVRTLLAAWATPGLPPLRVLGDGPLRADMEREAAERGLPVTFLGSRSRGEVLAEVGRARVQVVPSEWYEGFPMVVLEALASGTPVVAARIGSLEEIIEDGVCGTRFTPGDPADLARAVLGLLADPGRLAALRAGARARFEERYTAERNLDQIRDIYGALLRDQGRAPAGID